jgi:hypothetical protein
MALAGLWEARIAASQMLERLSEPVRSLQAKPVENRQKLMSD